MTEFIQAFFDKTSTDQFFDDYHTGLIIAPFDKGLLPAEDEWKLDYNTFETAAALRASETTGLGEFKQKIEAKGNKADI